MGSTGLSLLLRGALGVAGGIGFLLALAVIAAGEPVGAAWLLIGSAILILIALYEQARYRAPAGETPAATAPGGRGAVPPDQPPWSTPGRPAADRGLAGYQRTDEVFDDPTTGRRLRVWFDPTTGERRYVPEP